MTTPTGMLYDDPRSKPLSTAGQFQPGCYLCFFVTGSTTPTNVYADGALTTPLSQPTAGSVNPSAGTVADANGRFAQIYLNPATIYRVQLYSAAGVLLSDTDPYVVAVTSASLAPSATTDTTNASNITSGTLAAARLPASAAQITSSTAAGTLLVVNSSSTALVSSASVTVNYRQVGPLMYINFNSAAVTGLANSTSYLVYLELPTALQPASSGDVASGKAVVGMGTTGFLGQPFGPIQGAVYTGSGSIWTLLLAPIQSNSTSPAIEGTTFATDGSHTGFSITLNATYLMS